MFLYFDICHIIQYKQIYSINMLSISAFLSLRLVPSVSGALPSLSVSPIPLVCPSA